VSCGGTHSVALTRDGRMFSVSIFNTLVYGNAIVVCFCLRWGNIDCDYWSMILAVRSR
jgi:hypothetical protein